MQQLRRRLDQFNASVPYAGVSATARPDEVVLPALFSLLPVPQAIGITVPPPAVQVCRFPIKGSRFPIKGRQ